VAVSALSLGVMPEPEPLERDNGKRLKSVDHVFGAAHKNADCFNIDFLGGAT
jgi:hypothetical protein